MSPTTDPKKTAPRFRFAPSPTGYLHIGGARTALFNWLLARQLGGSFILRIEDTDRERSTDESIRSILEGMSWLKLDADEGPFRQTDRMELYKSHVDKLIAIGRAYKCFCTPEELEERKKILTAKGEKPKYDGRCRQANQTQDKPYCIRFLNRDEGATVVHDLIKGDVTFQNSELDDLVIGRSGRGPTGSGVPTYNLCVVIDDALMRISHVIRGDDHLNNTPRQIQLYEALDYPLPQFAHLPMILGADKSRLSKRHGATSVLAYRDMGFLPDALINFLSRIGWAHGDEEIFSREELIQKFSLDHVGKSGGVFNQEKLLWLNNHYLKNYGEETLATLVRPFVEKLGLVLPEGPKFLKAIALVKERAKTLVDLANDLKFFLVDTVEIDPEAEQKVLTPEALDLLREFTPQLQAAEPFHEATLKALAEDLIKSKGLKMVKLAQPLRVALTGTTVSPGIFEVMTILGKEQVLKRLSILP